MDALFLVKTWGAAITISAGNAFVLSATVTSAYNDNIFGTLKFEMDALRFEYRDAV